MSELTIVRGESRNFRGRLLTSVSALTLFALLCGSRDVRAADEDADRPTVWIELGGQLEQADADEQRFAPPFTAGITQLGFVSPAITEHPPRFSVGEEAAITFKPDGSDWAFSASVRYGRSQSTKHVHQETPGLENKFVTYYYGPPQPHTQFAQALDFADTTVVNKAAHAIVDFQIGKDVGLGMFGNGGHSTISAGVRFAQFVSTSRSGIKADQNVKFAHPISGNGYILYLKSQYNAYKASSLARRSFQGVGPSITWDASAAIARSDATYGITFDWGAKAAVLFGRQKAVVHQTSTASFISDGLNPNLPHVVSATQHSGASLRKKSVVIPNLGGFAAISFRYSAAKLSLGYRGDFFFGATDGGTAVRKSENVGFYGPFATISLGLGG